MSADDDRQQWSRPTVRKRPFGVEPRVRKPKPEVKPSGGLFDFSYDRNDRESKRRARVQIAERRDRERQEAEDALEQQFIAEMIAMGRQDIALADPEDFLIVFDKWKMERGYE